MDPGPIDSSVLSRQKNHRSENVWNIDPESNDCLTCRRIEGRIRRRDAQNELHPRMVDFLASSGFLGVSKIPFIALDWHLITALVERWRPETHTFHMPVGEVTITLQDVQMQFGLPINGPPVTAKLPQNWQQVCREFLNFNAQPRDLDGGRLKMYCLEDIIGELDEDAEDEDIIYATRAYILQLLGGLLFSDKSGNKVHLMFLPLLENLSPDTPYSWGSAVLGWLYRQLCHATNVEQQEISGAILLVQIWAWDRLPYIAPIRRELPQMTESPLAARWGVMKDVTNVSTHVVSQYRILLDKQLPCQFIWQPYSHDIMEELPYYCTEDSELWTAKVPLICFHIIEWHLPDRVVRQFGGIQGIPDDCDTSEHLHGFDLRSRTESGWPARHKKWIRLWQSRHNSQIEGLPGGLGEVRPEYMPWYLQHTRRWISRTGASICYLVEEMQKIRDLARRERVRSIEDMAINALRNFGLVEGAQPIYEPEYEHGDDEDHQTSDLVKRAEAYQQYMKNIEVPRNRGSLIPFTTWMGLGKSIKQLYGQPLHYLTNITLQQLDQKRFCSEDEYTPLDSVLHPYKAEAMIWLMEEAHRRTSSYLYIAEHWKSDPFYHASLDSVLLESSN